MLISHQWQDPRGLQFFFFFTCSTFLKWQIFYESGKFWSIDRNQMKMIKWLTYPMTSSLSYSFFSIILIANAYRNKTAEGGCPVLFYDSCVWKQKLPSFNSNIIVHWPFYDSWGIEGPSSNWRINSHLDIKSIPWNTENQKFNCNFSLSKNRCFIIYHCSPLSSFKCLYFRTRHILSYTHAH